MRVRNDSGQATVEQVGLMLVVALVLLGASAIAAVAAPGLVNRVSTTMQRALCTVAGQACPSLARQPCPVERTNRTTAARLSIGILRLGDDRALTIEQRSDGSYAIGLAEGVGAGVGVGAGARGADAGVDGLLSARASRTWIVSGSDEAAALVERLRRRALPAADHVVAGLADLAGLANADPSVDHYTLSGKAAGAASAKLGFGPIAEAGVGGGGAVELGIDIAAHRRQATAYIALDGRIGAFFDGLPAASLPLSRRTARRSPSGSAEQDGHVTFLNPDKLQLETQAMSRGMIALQLEPGPRVTQVEVTGIVSSGGEARELHVRLDPSTPEVAEALAAWRKSPADAGRLTALAHAAAAGAAIDERRFAYTNQTQTHGGEIGLGLKLGATLDRELHTYRLVAQRSKPVGGLWEERLDCGL